MQSIVLFLTLDHSATHIPAYQPITSDVLDRSWTPWDPRMYPEHYLLPYRPLHEAHGSEGTEEDSQQEEVVDHVQEVEQDQKHDGSNDGQQNGRALLYN